MLQYNTMVSLNQQKKRVGIIKTYHAPKKTNNVCPRAPTDSSPGLIQSIYNQAETKGRQKRKIGVVCFSPHREIDVNDIWLVVTQQTFELGKK